MSEKDIIDYLYHRLEDIHIRRGGEFDALRKALDLVRERIQKQMSDPREPDVFRKAILSSRVPGRGITETHLIYSYRQAELKAEDLADRHATLSKKVTEKWQGRLPDIPAEALKMQFDDLCRSISQLTEQVNLLH